MILISKYFWIMFIAGTLLNVMIMKAKFKKHIEEKPELKEGYDKISKLIIIFGNIPWTIMGIGIMLGFTNTVFDYFAPRQLNPFVLLFHISLIIIYIFIIKGIYFQGGAEFLERHPGLFQQSGIFSNKNNISAKEIKLWVGVMILGGILAMCAMWSINIPIENLTNMLNK